MAPEGAGPADGRGGEGTTKRTALRRARFVAVLVVVGLFALEQGLYHLGGYGRNPATTTDPQLGYRSLPNQSVRALDGTPFRINRDGYRDRAWRRERGEGVRRVALLGDSVTYGYHVPIEATWGRRLELHARNERGLDVEVMNFAQPGYVFEQLARVWDADVRAYRPDLVVLAINAHSAQPMQTFTPKSDFPLRSFVLKTAIYDYLRRGVFEDRGFLQFETDGPPDVLAARERDRALRAAMRTDPYAPDHAALWAAMHERCTALIEDCRASGAEVVVLCIPQLGDVLSEREEWCGDRWTAWAEDGLECTVLDALPDFRDGLAPILDELAAEDAAPRDLWSRRPDPALVQRFAGSPANLYLFHDPEHLSPAGHDRLAAWLVERLPLGAEDRR